VIQCLVERIEVHEAEGTVDIILHETLAELDAPGAPDDGDATAGKTSGEQEAIA